MKYLAPIPKQFVDQNGLPLSNGAVHVYISGDTQYANIYQDADGNELMPNPARLDSNGAWVGFVTAGIPLDYVVEDKDGNVQFEYEKVVAGGGSGGGDGPVYVQESHTSSDSNVTITSQKTTCTFDSDLEYFAGELHVRFQNSGQAATVTLYVNNEYNDKIVSTLPVISGMTHLMVPLSVPAGILRAEVTFATASTPSSVKFDLVGYNMGAGGGGGGQSLSATLPLKIEAGKITNNGTGLTCTGDNAWAEGKSNEATGHYSHVEGQLCKAKGQASHAGGQACETSGQNSFAHGAYLKTSNQSSCQAAFGMYNSDQKAMFVIGNGTAENNRKDAFKVDQSGHLWCMVNGTLTDVSELLASL